MYSIFRSRRLLWRSRSAFTLVELLTVIALIIAIAALAVPNFAAMLKEQRLTAAVNSLQVAIMRARTYAINGELDHAVEFCTDKGRAYWDMTAVHPLRASQKNEPIDVAEVEVVSLGILSDSAAKPTFAYQRMNTFKLSRSGKDVVLNEMRQIHTRHESLLVSVPMRCRRSLTGGTSRSGWKASR